jgi:hypothetical protein
MFNLFKKEPAPTAAQAAKGSTAIPAACGLQPFLEQRAGQSIHDGLYRVVDQATYSLGQEFVQAGFPHLAARVQCFGYDWLGSLFCLDSARMVNGGRGVLLLEPGTGKELAIPVNLESFHDEMVFPQPHALFCQDFYFRWLASGGSAPGPDQCVGYKKPLFLGGKDEVENLELSDLDVYWTISAQLIRKVRELPVGAKIDRVTIS